MGKLIKRPNTAKTLRNKYGEDYFSNMGKKGGATSGIKKGLAALSPERRQEIRQKRLETRRRNAEEQTKIRLEQENIAKSTKIGNFQTANHPTSGNVEISKGERGKFELKITNLKTDAGPDLKIIISPNDAENWKSNFVNLGDLKQFNGNFTFEIPQDTDLTQIQSVLIWCEEHDSLFGFTNLKQK